VNIFLPINNKVGAVICSDKKFKSSFIVLINVSFSGPEFEVVVRAMVFRIDFSKYLVPAE